MTENLENRIKELGGRASLYTAVAVNFSKKIGSKAKSNLNILAKKSYGKSREFMGELKEIPSGMKEFYSAASDAAKMLAFGFLPSNIQENLANNHLSELKDDNANPATITTMMNVFAEGMVGFAYGMRNDYKLFIPFMLDAAGRAYTLYKEGKPSGIGGGILKLPKMARDALDSICLKYLGFNQEEGRVK